MFWFADTAVRVYVCNIYGSVPLVASYPASNPHTQGLAVIFPKTNVIYGLKRMFTKGILFHPMFLYVTGTAEVISSESPFKELHASFLKLIILSWSFSLRVNIWMVSCGFRKFTEMILKNRRRIMFVLI